MAAFGELLLGGWGSDVVAVDLSGAVHRSIATGLRVTALAAFDQSVVVCERGIGTIALFDSGSATVWTGFTDPAAVAVSADAVFVAEEATRRIVRVTRTTGERA